MGADEEYLDNLLKSVTADLEGEKNETEDETISDEETFSVEDLFGTQEPFFVENENGEAEEVSIDDLIFGDDEPEEEVADGDTTLDIDAMLKELNLLNDDMAVPGLESEEINLEAEETDPMAEPFYSNDLDEDLNEINSLLEKADNNEAIDEDMLTMFSAESAVHMDEEEPFDIMGAINSQDVTPAVEDKKAEKERKRKEKEAAKEAKKAAKEAAKAQKKVKKGTKEAEPVEEDKNLMLNQVEQSSDEEDSAFGSFQEVEEFDDIEALLGSLNMDDLEFTTAPVESNTNNTVSEPETMPSMDDLSVDENVKTGGDTPVENKKEKKKEGLFKRFVDFLMEEDEEDEEEDKKKKKKVQTVDVNGEDDAVMAELEKRGKKAEKAQKAKKGKNKNDSDLDEDGGNDKKEKGKKKVKKPKKEKQPQSEMAKKFKVVDDGKKIGKAGGLVVVLLAASVFAVVMLSNIIFSPLLAKNRAEKAFNEQDYETCYQELSGWDLNEDEAEMRDFARVVLKLERRLDAYEQYKGLRLKLEALDSLMKAVQNYEEIYQEALNCGAEGEVEARYVTILDLLEEEYGLSRKEAEAIAALKSDVEYTRHLTAVIEGVSVPGLEGSDTDELPGFLPEEEELPDTKFSE